MGKKRNKVAGVLFTSNYVKEKDGGWFVFSEDGKKLGGPYKTEDEAKKRLKQIEFFKSVKENVMKKGFQSVVANVTGGTRYEELMGQKYLVAPMVMLTEGVHCGSGGALFYPKDELSKIPEVWNHKPIVVYHPMANGESLSACSPDVLNTRGVGMIMNTNFGEVEVDKDGKKVKIPALKAEAWLNTERIKKVDNRIAEALEKKIVMELSTGLFTENEETAGEWNGEKYSAIARNFKPDHLALLPDMEGACSVADGAGLLRNNKENKNIYAVLQEAGISLENNQNSQEEIRSLLCSALRDSKGENCWLEATYDNYLIYSMDGKLLKANYVVTKDTVEIGNKADEVVRVLEYKTKDEINVNRKESVMLKAEKIEAIIKNDGNSFTEEDKEVLNAFDEATLDKLMPVENKEAKKDEDEDAEDEKDKKKVENAEVKKEEVPETLESYVAKAPVEIQETLRAAHATYCANKKAVIAKIIANKKNIFTKEQLDKKDLAELAALNKLASDDKKAMFDGQMEFVDNTAAADVKPLVMPVMNFGK